MKNPITTAFYDQWTIMTSWISGTLSRLSDADLCAYVGRNHGIWILGHLIESEDELGVYLGKADWMFPDYADMFGQGSVLLPADKYPSAAVLREQWRAVLDRNHLLLQALSDAEWDEPHTQIHSGVPVDKDFFRTKGRCIAIWNIHQAHHNGQLSILAAMVKQAATATTT